MKVPFCFAAVVVIAVASCSPLNITVKNSTQRNLTSNPWETYHHFLSFRSTLSQLHSEIVQLTNPVDVDDRKQYMEELLSELMDPEEKSFSFSEWQMAQLNTLITSIAQLFAEKGTHLNTLPQEEEQQQQPILNTSMKLLRQNIYTNGYTPRNLARLKKRSEKYRDAYALELLAYYYLFEPVHTEKVKMFEAFRLLSEAASQHLHSAKRTIALFRLTGIFGELFRNSSFVEDIQVEEAHDMLKMAAENGDYIANLVLAYKYSTGILSDSSEISECYASLPYYSLCAREAINKLLRSSDGQRYVKPASLSYHWHKNEPLIASADPADANAEMMEYYRTLAAQPNNAMAGEAMHRLGELYYFGGQRAAAHGVNVDYNRAAHYFRRAASTGISQSQANLGVMYANGIGVKKSSHVALQYFEKAAKKNNTAALSGLGYMHLNGVGVSKNESQAVEYFKKAASLGLHDAHSLLGVAYLQGNGVGLNKSKAFDHFEHGSKNGVDQSIFNLGVLHLNGWGTSTSCEKAVVQFHRVSKKVVESTKNYPFSNQRGLECYKKGDMERALLNYIFVSQYGASIAQCNAAFLLRHNTLKFENISFNSNKKAFKLYEEAASHGNPEAYFELGSCFEDSWNGTCVQNSSLALQKYKIAAENGDYHAMFSCGRMYLFGNGSSHDLILAKTFFKKCASSNFPVSIPCMLPYLTLELFISSMEILRYFSFLKEVCYFVPNVFSCAVIGIVLYKILG